MSRICGTSASASLNFRLGFGVAQSPSLVLGLPPNEAHALWKAAGCNAAETFAGSATPPARVATAALPEAAGGAGCLAVAWFGGSVEEWHVQNKNVPLASACKVRF